MVISSMVLKNILYFGIIIFLDPALTPITVFNFANLWLTIFSKSFLERTISVFKLKFAERKITKVLRSQRMGKFFTELC